MSALWPLPVSGKPGFFFFFEFNHKTEFPPHVQALHVQALHMQAPLGAVRGREWVAVCGDGCEHAVCSDCPRGSGSQGPASRPLPCAAASSWHGGRRWCLLQLRLRLCVRLCVFPALQVQGRKPVASFPGERYLCPQARDVPAGLRVDTWLQEGNCRLRWRREVNFFNLRHLLALSY